MDTERVKDITREKEGQKEKQQSESQQSESQLRSKAGSQMSEQEYGEYVKQVTPTHSTPLNVARAFLVGGLICCLGQAITNGLISAGVEAEAAGTWTSVILVAAAILATGFNWFGQIVKFGGAGALVPITGFANSVVSPAIEYKKEERVIITLSQKCRCFR